ncbi:MAG: class I SAM-dependent methyltransferase [Flavobacteriaceae bacterium]|nr:class I SAM-dependent methyltransferase [Flavobacteriaceae bacterium]
MTYLTDKGYWELVKKRTSIQTIPKNHQLRQFIEEHTPSGIDKTCIEIGAYPGRFLPVFGDLNYELNGIDFVSGYKQAIIGSLLNKNYSIGDFFNEDFLKFKPKKKYDLVFSGGFIEHFLNLKEVIRLHCNLVNKGGTLIITAPNFNYGIQKILHRTLDNKNFLRHNPDSMNPKKWAEHIIENGFTINYSGPVGYFDYWYEDVKNPFIKSINNLVKNTTWATSRILPKNSFFSSPFIAIVATKK